MKTMRNEYRDLKKENDLIFSTLAEYDRDTITEIISVVDNTRGIGYEVELVRKDLIAMAAQAEARRDYLPSVIGDVEVFKRNLLASMPKPKLADYMQTALCGCAPLRWFPPRPENISIKCERGFTPFSHYFFTESEVRKCANIDTLPTTTAYLLKSYMRTESHRPALPGL